MHWPQRNCCQKFANWGSVRIKHEYCPQESVDSAWWWSESDDSPFSFPQFCLNRRPGGHLAFPDAEGPGCSFQPKHVLIGCIHLSSSFTRLGLCSIPIDKLIRQWWQWVLSATKITGKQWELSTGPADFAQIFVFFLRMLKIGNIKDVKAIPLWNVSLGKLIF